jgi:hypothetical protein
VEVFFDGCNVGAMNGSSRGVPCEEEEEDMASVKRTLVRADYK